MVSLLNPSVSPPRKPPWLKVRLPGGHEFHQVRKVLSGLRLHSICQEARCPNIAECFHGGTATFLILGNICTRHCRYCHVVHGIPRETDTAEPERLIEAVKTLALQYVVITSVTRDDLPDGGAGMFARCIDGLRRHVPDCKVEVLIPDLQGNGQALAAIMEKRPDVINHNVEVVPALFGDLRPQGDYGRSLELLHRINKYNNNKSIIKSLDKAIPEGFPGRVVSKSGFMVGFGESGQDIEKLLDDLASVRCEHLTVGQYQQPTRSHWPVVKYYHPDEFAAIKARAYGMGFKHVEAGPLVRSSYHAAQAYHLSGGLLRDRDNIQAGIGHE